MTAQYQDAKDYLINKINSLEIQSQQHLRDHFEYLVHQYGSENGLPYVFESRADQEKVFAEIVANFLNEEAQDFTFGALEPILADPDVVEIMINGTKGIFVDKGGEITKSKHQFETNEQIMRVIDLITRPMGRVVNESNPVVDVRLPDGSRVNIVIPPITLDGPLVTIRKFIPNSFSWDDLIDLGTVSAEVVSFLQATVESRLNIAVIGGQGAGKTTLLNNLMRFIGQDERVIATQNASELMMESDQFLRLETRPPNVEGRGEVSMTTLVQNALKMRPDRIIVSDVRGGEAIDVLQAMNTGIDGSMFTLQANTPRDSLARLETMTLLGEPSIPVRAIREQMASAIDLIIHIQRLRDGSRKILFITEVIGMENNLITMQNLFEYNQTDYQDGTIIGELQATGAMPRFYERLDSKIPKSLFTAPDSSD